MDMKATALQHGANGPFSLNGTCPHCNHLSVFVAITQPHVETVPPPNYPQQVAGYKSWAILQCQGCRNFILGGVSRNVQGEECRYLVHYPVDKPNEDVSTDVPEEIRDDFKEALRCRWVNAYNATAEMCRRAIEASCINLGAPARARFLEDKIDWLASQGKITPFLQQVAHKIRLGGARAAHPPDKPTPPDSGELEAEPRPAAFKITQDHADAIIAFTKEYFHHVYVVQKQLDKYDFSKAGTRS